MTDVCRFVISRLGKVLKYRGGFLKYRAGLGGSSGCPKLEAAGQNSAIPSFNLGVGGGGWGRSTQGKGPLGPGVVSTPIPPGFS